MQAVVQVNVSPTSHINSDIYRAERISGSPLVPPYVCQTNKRPDVMIAYDLYVRNKATIQNLLVTGSIANAGNTTSPTISVLAELGKNAMQAPGGSANAPSYSFLESPNTGLYTQTTGRFALAAGGVDTLKYDGNSILNVCNYKVRAYNSAEQSLPTSDVLTLIFPNKPFDPQNCLSEGTFTAPVTGTYLVILNVQITGISALQTVTWSLTDSSEVGYLGYQLSSLLNLVSLGSFNAGVSWMTMIPLTAGSTLQVRASNGLASLITIQPNRRT